MYDSQLLKNRIVDLVDSLPEDGLQLLSEFTSFLRLKYQEVSDSGTSSTIVYPQRTNLSGSAVLRERPARIYSPRLVDSSELSKFELEVIHEEVDE